MSVLFDPTVYNHEAPLVRLELPDEELARLRISEVYAQARPEEVEHGHNWFISANLICEQWSERFGGPITPEHVAGIIASLSPIQSWEQNLVLAERLLATGTCRGLGYAVRDARLIYSGFHPEVVLYDQERNNKKVRAFYENLARPLMSDAVTIDRHMISLLVGYRRPDEEQNWIRMNAYRWAEEQFKKLAAELGLLPHQLQAVTWVVWRRLHGIAQVATSEQLKLVV